MDGVLMRSMRGGVGRWRGRRWRHGARERCTGGVGSVRDRALDRPIVGLGVVERARGGAVRVDVGCADACVDGACVERVERRGRRARRGRARARGGGRRAISLAHRIVSKTCPSWTYCLPIGEGV